MPIKNKFKNIISLLSFVGVFVFGAQVALATTYVAELQAKYPKLSDEDALYISQQMEFLQVPITDDVAVEGFVNEKLSQINSNALVFPTEVKTVNVVKVSDREYKVSFSLKNQGAAQSGVMYRVSLRSPSVEGADQEPRTYSNVYSEILSIPTGGEIERTADFLVPSYVLPGDYLVAVELAGEHGVISAVGTAPDLISVSNNQPKLEIAYESCLVNVDSESVSFDRLSGVDVASDEELSISCIIKNVTDENLIIKPKYETHLRNLWGKKVGDDAYSELITLLAREEKTIKFVIPKAQYAQAYDVKISLLEGDSLALEPLVVHYVIQGESATIHSVTLDSTYYAANSVARLNLAWTGSADNFAGARSGGMVTEDEVLTAEVSLHTLSGQACSDVVPQVLPQDVQGLVEIEIPVNSECSNVVAEVTLKNKEGIILADKTYNFSFEDFRNEEIADHASNTNKIIFILVIVGALLLLMLLVMLRKRKVSSEIAVFLIAISSFGISAFVYAGSFYSSTNIWSVPDQGWSLHTATIAFSGPSGTYRNSQQVSFTGNVATASCANTRARSAFYLTITGPTNRNGSWGASSFSQSYRANQFANGSYRAVIRWTDAGCRYIGGTTARRPADPNLNYQCTQSPDVSETFYFTIDNNPAGTVDAGGCTIASGASSCTTPVDWSITNPDGSPNLRNLTHNYVYSWSASGNNVWQRLWYGTQTIAARDGSTNLDTVSVTASCAAGTVWAGGICSPAPIVNLSASPALIGPGNTSTLTWTVSGATSCSASGGWSGNKNATGGTEVVSPSVTTTYTLTCTGGGGSSNRSTTVTLPSGSVTAMPCAISPESSSCLSNVSWVANNFLGAAQVTQTSSGQVAGSNPGTLSVTPSDRTIRLDDLGSNFEITTTADATCSAGGVWVPSLNRCASLPTIVIDADPDVIRSGDTADLDIDITSPYDLTCTLAGGVTDTITHRGSVTPSGNYTSVTRPLTAAQIVRITCVADIAPDLNNSAETRVNVVPVLQEV